jgi:hypothetical protein
MRKRSRKLALHRETLRQLDPLQARRAVGGATSDDCLQATGCECATDGCIGPTWWHTCGTTCTVPTGFHQC